MPAIFFLLSLIYIKAIFEMTERTGITVIAAVLIALVYAAGMTALNIAAALRIASWSQRTHWVEKEMRYRRPTTHWPFGAILPIAVPAVAALIGIAYLIIMGFSSRLFNNLSYGLENGDYSSVLMLAAPLLAHLALIVLGCRQALKGAASRNLDEE